MLTGGGAAGGGRGGKGEGVTPIPNELGDAGAMGIVWAMTPGGDPTGKGKGGAPAPGCHAMAQTAGASARVF